MFDSPDHDMVASFMLKKPVSLLQDNILRLEGDIFDEIEAPTIKVSAVPYYFFNFDSRVFFIHSFTPSSFLSLLAYTLFSSIQVEIFL